MIGLASSGVHSNGFSLVRKVFDIDTGTTLQDYADVLGKPLGETLLTPTRLYVKPVLHVLKEVNVKSIAHITGGGFYENLPRAYNETLNASITKGSWPILPIFNLLQEKGNIPEHDMFNTFNMGIGMVVIVSPEDVEKTISILKQNGVEAYQIGVMEEGDHSVVIHE